MSLQTEASFKFGCENQILAELLRGQSRQRTDSVNQSLNARSTSRRLFPSSFLFVPLFLPSPLLRRLCAIASTFDPLRRGRRTFGDSPSSLVDAAAIFHLSLGRFEAFCRSWIGQSAISNSPRRTTSREQTGRTPSHFTLRERQRSHLVGWVVSKMFCR